MRLGVTAGIRGAPAQARETASSVAVCFRLAARRNDGHMSRPRRRRIAFVLVAVDARGAREPSQAVRSVVRVNSFDPHPGGSPASLELRCFSALPRAPSWTPGSAKLWRRRVGLSPSTPGRAARYQRRPTPLGGSRRGSVGPTQASARPHVSLRRVDRPG